MIQIISCLNFCDGNEECHPLNDCEGFCILCMTVKDFAVLFG